MSPIIINPLKSSLIPLNPIKFLKSPEIPLNHRPPYTLNLIIPLSPSIPDLLPNIVYPISLTPYTLSLNLYLLFLIPYL